MFFRSEPEGGKEKHHPTPLGPEGTTNSQRRLNYGKGTATVGVDGTFREGPSQSKT